MKKPQRLAVSAMKRRRQAIAFDANVQRVYKVGTPYAIACLKEYEELTAAIDEIEAAAGKPAQLGLFAR